MMLLCYTTGLLKLLNYLTILLHANNSRLLLRINERLYFVRSCIRYESAFVQFIALHGLHARSRSLFGRNVVYCAERFNCSINDLIYGRLSIIINSYVRNSFDENTLDRVAFLRELIMIRDSYLSYQACYLATS